MTPALAIRKAGPAVSVQDFGRPGHAHDGISPSGAMDPEALIQANALCGNAKDEAAIEFGLAGLVFEVAARSVRVATAGAAFALTIDGRAVQGHRSHVLHEGQVMAIGAASRGVWGYLALEGGLALEPVLGSRSTHWRSGLGGLDGRLLQAGDRLPLRRGEAGPGGAMQLPPRLAVGGPIRVMLGPQAEAFTEAGIATFLGAAWRIGRTVDRMGYRLEGPAVAHATGFNIVSDGIVRGSVQIPGQGRPIVMMADHQTTGGYPKIATVIGADLARLAQLPPGAECRFAAVGLEEALAARREAERALARGLRQIAASAEDLTRRLDSERLLGLNLVSGAVADQDGDDAG